MSLDPGNSVLLETEEKPEDQWYDFTEESGKLRELEGRVV